MAANLEEKELELELAKKEIEQKIKGVTNSAKHCLELVKSFKLWEEQRLFVLYWAYIHRADEKTPEVIGSFGNNMDELLSSNNPGNYKENMAAIMMKSPKDIPLLKMFFFEATGTKNTFKFFTPNVVTQEEFNDAVEAVNRLTSNGV